MKNTYTRFVAGAALAVFCVVSIGMPAQAATLLTRQLDQGMSGADVSLLQTFLAADRTIYPQGLVTGYYGTLTTSAVANLQARNNIPSVGRVGPITLTFINARLTGEVVPVLGEAPTLSTVVISTSRNGATVNWNTNQLAKGVVYYSATPLIAHEQLNSVDVSGLVAMTDTSYRTSQSVAIGGLAANTTYYYMVYTTNQNGYVSVSVPSQFYTTN